MKIVERVDIRSVSPRSATVASRALSAAAIATLLLGVAAPLAHGAVELAREIASAVAPEPGQSALKADADLNAALAESKRDQRVLVVELTPAPDRARAASERWASPVLSAWIRRHGVAIGVSDRNTLRTLSDAGIQQGAGNDPLLFRDGVYLRGFGVLASTSKSVDENGVESWRFSTRQESRLAKPKGITPAGIDMVFKLDWSLRGVERTDAAWLSGHMNAIGAEPAWPVATLSADFPPPNIEARIDPPPPRVVLLLNAARKLAASEKPDDLKRAGEAYLALWERGVALDPAFNIARLTIVSAEMHALAQRHAPTKELFKRALASRWVGVNTRDISALWDVLTLARVVDEHTPVLEFIDNALNDADSTKVMPLDERLTWELALPRMHFNSVTEKAPAMLSRVRSDQRRLSAKRPEIVTPVEWARLTQSRRFIALLEGSRLVATAAQRADDATVRELHAQLVTMSRQTTPGPGEPDWSATIDMTIACAAALPVPVNPPAQPEAPAKVPAPAAPAGAPALR